MCFSKLLATILGSVAITRWGQSRQSLQRANNWLWAKGFSQDSRTNNILRGPFCPKSTIRRIWHTWTLERAGSSVNPQETNEVRSGKGGLLRLARDGSGRIWRRGSSEDANFLGIWAVFHKNSYLKLRFWRRKETCNEVFLNYVPSS